MHELVMTKKDKFRNIASRVFDIVRISNYFRGKGEAVSKSFNDEEKETYNVLWRAYMDGLTPRHANNPEYDKYIEMVSVFVKSVVNKYVPQEARKHGNGYEFNFDFLEQHLDVRETESWKIGSKFTCILSEDVQLQRISLETDEDGNWINHIYGYVYSPELKDFKPEVANMGEGLYVVVGSDERMDIDENWNEMTLKINCDDKDKHPILQFENEAPKDENDSGFYFEESIEEECSRCRGGGCPSCDTTGFFTGIKVYR